MTLPRLLGSFGAAVLVGSAAASTWMSPLGRGILVLAALAALVGVAIRRRAVVGVAGTVALLAFTLFTLSTRKAGSLALVFTLFSPGIWLILIGGLCLVVSALLPAKSAG